MTISKQPGRPIVIGIPWRFRVQVNITPVPFPAGVVLVGQMRRRTADSVAVATLRTADGSITRVDDNTIDLFVPAASTAALAPGSVVFDFMRTDTGEPLHSGFTMTIPVVQPVTRTLT